MHGRFLIKRRPTCDSEAVNTNKQHFNSSGFFSSCVRPLKPGVRNLILPLEVQLYFTFPLNSQLTIYSVQICDLTMMYSTFEKKETMEITTWGIF